MAIPDLESVTPMLFNTCDTRLGDTITITPPSAAPITIKAHAAFGDRRQDFGLSASTVQDAAIDIDMALVPGKPDATWRVTFLRIPGHSYAPRDVQRDLSGFRWEFGVKEVKGG